MATPNYSFEKRRKELERKSKKERSAQRKLERKNAPVAEAASSEPDSPLPPG